jgi:hypothetical protein
MPAPDFMPDDNWQTASRPVVGKVTPARGVPLPIRSRLHDDDIERIARRVVELLKNEGQP